MLDGRETIQLSEGTKFQEALAPGLVLNYFVRE